MFRIKLAACLLGLIGLSSPAAAVECRDITHAGQAYTICSVDAAQEDIRLFLNHPETGKPLGSFTNIKRELRKSGAQLMLAMNAGMYHSDRAPVGLYVEDGQELAGIVTADGPGNFGLLPNGVFCVQEGRALVMESRRFAKARPACKFASQSGPMLVINGALHPRFIKDSTSRYVRNGVGVSADGRQVWFAISKGRVTFHQFGSLFRDHMKTPQALYFDGNISRLYAPSLDRRDGGFPMGPMVGVVAPAQ